MYALHYQGTFRVYPLPDDPATPLPPRMLSNLPSSDVEECIVRLYVVQASGLQPNDSSGLADPYIQVKLGKKKMDTRDNYVPNSLNPVFGRYGMWFCCTFVGLLGGLGWL